MIATDIILLPRPLLEEEEEEEEEKEEEEVTTNTLFPRECQITASLE